MKRIGHFLYRTLAVFIIACISLSLLSTNVMVVSAKEDNISFQTYVNAKDVPLFIGDFLTENGELYISTNTITALSNSDNVAVDGDYVPFVEVLNQMGYTAEFAESERMLRIREKEDYTELLAVMEEIYDNKGYNMFYWQNSGVYEADVEVALAADCIKNFSYISYLSGHETDKQFEDAFWKILLPEENADLDVLGALEDTGKKTKETYEIGKDLVKLIGQVAEWKGIKGFETFKNFEISNDGEKLDVAAEKFGKLVGYYQLDDVKELLVFTDVMSSTNQAAVRGIDVVSNKYRHVETDVAKAGNKVIDIYQGNASVEEEFWRTLIGENTLDMTAKASNDFVFGAAKVLADIVNKIADARLNTQAQVNATIGASRCLDIQKNCNEYYRTLEKKLEKADWDKYDAIMREMHDVTVVYLLAGAEAYRAVAIDSELKAASGRILKNFDADLTLLAEYHDEQFAAVENLQETEEKLISYAEQLSANTDDLELTPLTTQGTMTIVWSGEGMNGWNPETMVTYMEPYDLNVLLEGGFDDGSVLTGFSDGMYFTENGKLVAQVNESEQQVIIEFFDMDAYYTVTIENSFPDNGWTGNTQITLDAPGVTNFDAMNYLNRGMTGFWYYSIILDHGVPGQAY